MPRRRELAAAATPPGSRSPTPPHPERRRRPDPRGRGAAAADPPRRNHHRDRLPQHPAHPRHQDRDRDGFPDETMARTGAVRGHPLCRPGLLRRPQSCHTNHLSGADTPRINENSTLLRLSATKITLVVPALAAYTGRRSGGRVVEGTPLLRVQAGNRLEGSNPFRSATSRRSCIFPQNQ